METTRQIKKKLLFLLKADNFEKTLEAFPCFPARKAVNPLFSFLYSSDERIKYRAVTALGIIVAHHATQDLESARVIMRRFIWNLNDESGGIGWGSPEAMGEIMAQSEPLAKEYANLLVSYMMPDGNFLEHPILQRGLLWGIGRLAHARPERLQQTARHLLFFLQSEDPIHRGLSAWALGALGDMPDIGQLEPMCHDRLTLRVYIDFQMVDRTVGELATEAIAQIKGAHAKPRRILSY
jgi:hypothetical protein